MLMSLEDPVKELIIKADLDCKLDEIEVTDESEKSA